MNNLRTSLVTRWRILEDEFNKEFNKDEKKNFSQAFNKDEFSKHTFSYALIKILINTNLKTIKAVTLGHATDEVKDKVAITVGKGQTQPCADNSKHEIQVGITFLTL